MADMKPQIYKDDRPAEYFDQFHESARTGRRLDLLLRAGRSSRCRPCCSTGCGRSASRTCRRPAALILAPNHFSQMDHFFIGLYLAPQDPLHGQIADLRPAGAHLRLQARRCLPGAPRPPRRGGVQDRLHAPRPGGDAARLRRGRSLALAAGWASRKPGIGRIALESGAPIVPVAIQGSASVRRWKRFTLPQGHGPVRRAAQLSRSSPSPSRERQLEVASEIFDRVREMYAALSGGQASRQLNEAREKRFPLL